MKKKKEDPREGLTEVKGVVAPSGETVAKHDPTGIGRFVWCYQAVSPEVENELLDAPRIANARIYVGMKSLGRKKRAEELASAAKAKP